MPFAAALLAMPLDQSLLAACFLVATLLLCRWSFEALSNPKLPLYEACRLPTAYPHKDWIFGLDGLLDAVRAAKEHRYLDRQRHLHAKLGATFSSKSLGSMSINTIEPENIRAILSESFSKFDTGERRRKAFAPLLGHGIFQLDGNQWRMSRKFLQPMFRHAKLKDVGLFESWIQKLLPELPCDGLTVVDLCPKFDELAANVILEFLFGEAVCSADNTLVEALHEAQKGCERRWLLAGIADYLPHKGFAESLALVHECIDKFAEKALEQSSVVEGRQSFTQELVQVSHDKVFLRDELLTLLIAGLDTVGALLTNLFFLLARHPACWQQLRDEVATLDGKPPNFEQLKGLKYARQCINEALRIHPVLPSNSRIANTDTVLPRGGGPDGSSPLFVRKGTAVSFSIISMHRCKNLWGDDAESFSPKRWDREREALNWKFIPFMGGPRVCLGRDFAYNQVTYVLVRMAQSFKSIQSADPSPWVEDISMACTSKNGAKVILVPA